MSAGEGQCLLLIQSWASLRAAILRCWEIQMKLGGIWKVDSHLFLTTILKLINAASCIQFLFQLVTSWVPFKSLISFNLGQDLIIFWLSISQLVVEQNSFHGILSLSLLLRQMMKVTWMPPASWDETPILRHSSQQTVLSFRHLIMNQMFTWPLIFLFH